MYIHTFSEFNILNGLFNYLVALQKTPVRESTTVVENPPNGNLRDASAVPHLLGGTISL